LHIYKLKIHTIEDFYTKEYLNYAIGLFTDFGTPLTVYLPRTVDTDTA